MSIEEYCEDDFLALSGIQHFIFCKRQWALIHIECQWKDNVLTALGNVVHEKAHSNIDENRGDIKISRDVCVHSRKLGIYGICDVVEFTKDEIIPVEYKKGKPKEDDSDIMQLVLQCICLEEMLCQNIDYGFLYYDEIKHRQKVVITSELREKAIEITKAMHDMYDKGYTPKAVKTKKCSNCSLKEICLPRISKVITVSTYIKNSIKEIENEETT